MKSDDRITRLECQRIGLKDQMENQSQLINSAAESQELKEKLEKEMCMLRSVNSSAQTNLEEASASHIEQTSNIEMHS